MKPPRFACPVYGAALRRSTLATAVLVVLASPPPRAAAQGAGSAMLRGVVSDTSGGVLPAAAVTLTNLRTNAVRTATTDASGGHVFAALVPGDYRLRVEASGFAPWQSPDVHLSPGDSIQLDATLAVAGRTERVSVTAERPIVRTDSGTREGLITSQQIQDLSIVSRGALELLRILPGTVTPEQTSLETVSFGGGVNTLYDYSVNGNRGTQMSAVLDGSKIVDFASNQNVMLNMNTDMVDEVKVQAGNYAAEYGSPSIQISAVTKGGSSRFHGSVYDYWRSWRLNANDRSNNYAGIPQPKNEYQYPGLNLSGPLVVPGTDFNRDRRKLFFFVGYEYQHQIIDPGTTFGVVPTPAQRTGDFSELLAGSGLNLGQPPVVTIPWGFPGEGEPAPHNDLSPYVDGFGQAYMNIYPLPNYADPSNRYNYAFNAPIPANRWQLTSRLDWNVSETTHAYVRLALEREEQRSLRGNLWGDRSTFALPSRTVNAGRSWSVAANVTTVFDPSLTNETVVSASQLKLDNGWEDASKMSHETLGLEGFQGIFPDDSAVAPIDVQTWSQNLGNLSAPGGLPVYGHSDSLSFADTVTKVAVAHTVKLGVFVERGQRQQNWETSQGLIALGGSWNAGGTGNDYGDLLAGRPAFFNQSTTTPHGEFRFWNFEGSLQDAWRPRRDLTLEAGLRVAKLPNNEELTGLAMRFEPSAYDYSQGPYIDGDPQRPNGVLLARRGEIPNGITSSPGVLFMPRLNFAWNPRGSGDWTLRGGAGLFYNRPRGNFQYSVIWEPPNTFNTLVSSWDVPGGLTLPSLPTIDPRSRLGFVDSLDPNSIHVPRTWSWSLALARRLPWQQTLEVAYVGNRADHLPDVTLINYIPPGTLTGVYGNADLDNPLHRAALDITVVAKLSSYPAYATPSWWYQYEGWSNYNALQATLSRSAGRHVQYFLNYTFSKALGTTGADYALLDPIDPGQRSYGLLLQDRTHVFNASYNLLLPDPVRREGNALLRHLLNGWQVSGITSYRSGAPFRVYLGGELTFDSMLLAWWGTDAHRPGDYTASGAITPLFAADPRTGRTGTGEKILDISKIAIPALGESGPFQQPYDFRAPSRWNWDVTLFKNFSLGGDKRLQLRVGFFNLFNQAAPNIALGDIDLNLVAECNVRVDRVPNGAGGYADGVCDPTQGFHFTDQVKQSFGRIITKRGHRVIELAARFDF